MRSEVEINELEIPCVIGVYPEERKSTQTLLLTTKIGLIRNPAVSSDALSDTLDYNQLSIQLRHHAKNKRYQLLERLVGDFLKIIQSYPNVESVEITLKKPSALSFAKSVSVSLYWHASQE